MSFFPEAVLLTTQGLDQGNNIRLARKRKVWRKNSMSLPGKIILGVERNVIKSVDLMKYYKEHAVRKCHLPFVGASIRHAIFCSP